MILYHGSNVEITQINLNLSKVGKDFGCGFYLSEDKKQALELARRKTEQLDQGFPTVTKFKFNDEFIQNNNVSILRFNEYNRDWAEFVLLNRKNKSRTPAHNYDIVIGPIANDTVGYQIRRYTSGLIDMTKFLEELKYMKGISFQYFFGTEKSIKLLKNL
ncbi:MAG: DUF3990 domain-containing protein [Muribaculaceae bacterium]